MQLQRFAQKALTFNQNEELLLIEYAQSKFLPKKLNGKKALPGGRIDFGEQVDQSIIREVLEETGIIIKPGLCVACWNWEYLKNNDFIQINAVSRVCKYISGEPKTHKSESELLISDISSVHRSEVKDLEIVHDELSSISLFLTYWDFYTGLF